jgi:hypothetical protein
MDDVDGDVCDGYDDGADVDDHILHVDMMMLPFIIISIIVIPITNIAIDIVHYHQDDPYLSSS